MSAPMSTRAGTSAHDRTLVPGAAVADAAAVLVFVLLGRSSHDEAATLAGVVRTASPFLAGLAIGWLALRVWRNPVAPLRTGFPLAVVTVAAGMVLRAVSGQGVAVPFVLVAVGVVAALLVGWRAGRALVAHARRAGRG